MLTSWSEQSTPGRVVDRVGVDAAAGGGVLDAPALRQPEVAALADDAGAQLAPVDADRVGVAVADLGVRLVRGLDERADAAVPEQVDRARAGSRARARRDRAPRPRSPSAARASGESGTDFSVRDHTPPPAEIAARS